MIHAAVLFAGKAFGSTLVLTAPLSFWGAYNPRTGCIVDTHHPQAGACLKDQILLMSETRGSGGSPGGLAEAIRLGTAPAGIILITPDINLAVGAAVAARLYHRACPVLAVAAADFDVLKRQRALHITGGGAITF